MEMLETRLHLGLTRPESDKVSIEIAEPVTGDHCYQSYVAAMVHAGCKT